MSNDLHDLVSAGNFAGIMRECLSVFDTWHPEDRRLAFLQNVNLRKFLTMIYEGQPKSDDPVSITALATVAHGLLSEGKLLYEIMRMPSADLLAMAEKYDRARVKVTAGDAL